ncbi:hypothetical protein FGO68_gene11668 [Halteria grandinella]|uniref:Carboxypeptidase n=1 Tax=Halteria grandinella TaxID=5974 RepID=A0A8J8T288_HALGN|nr:hypothetical protein FGO68_gene11668 [Halteria grandinella]
MQFRLNYNLMKALYAVTQLAFLIILAQACKMSDKVHKIPGMKGLKTKTYSGFVPINGTSKQLHYIAAMSKHDAKRDPVIIWFNGGPGCSSLMGWAQEHGPYVIEDGGSDFFKNNYSWNKEATVIYLESPAGVGFSICPIPEECNFDDDSAAEDNFIALLNLFSMKFPELQGNDLWLAGESYAGIYVPYLVRLIDQYNIQNPSNDFKPNLKGFILGNPLTDLTFDIYPAAVELLYQHAMLDRDTYYGIKDQCTTDVWQHFRNARGSCLEYIRTFYQLYRKINIYDIYKRCYTNTLQSDPSSPDGRYFNTVEDFTPFITERMENMSDGLLQKGGQSCTYDDKVVNYFRDEKVRKALNIPEGAPQWRICQKLSYQQCDTGSIDIYDEIKERYRILIFSGNTDGAIPTIGTLNWIQSLNWDVSESWRPYFVNGQLAGYTESRLNSNFVFASIHGTGHMAPQWKKAEVYHVVFSFIKDSII